MVGILTIAEAAAYLKTSERSLYRWIKAEQIAVERVNGRPYITLDEVRRVETNLVGAP